MPDTALSFDRHQFAGWQPGHGMKEMTTAGFDYSDRGNIQRVRHVTRLRKWIPEWTSSDEKLRKVLLRRIQMHKHYSHVNMKAFRLMQAEICAIHNDAVARAGSYAALQAAIAYRSWRLGWHSPDVAESLGVSPGMV